MTTECEKCPECFWCDCDVRKMAQEIFKLETKISILTIKDTKALEEAIEDSFGKFTAIL